MHFLCASCIKQYVQPSYGCRGTPVVARMCLYCTKKIFLYIKCNYKNVLEQERKTFKKRPKSRDAAVKRTDTRGVGIRPELIIHLK